MASPPSADHAQLRSQFAAILQDASKQYSDSWGTRLEDFNYPPINTVEELMENIEAQNINFSKFRDRQQVIFRSLHKALKPVEIVAKLLAGTADDPFKPTQGIYYSVLSLVNAAHDVTNTYDIIIDLFGQLENFARRVDVYVKYPMSPALRKTLVDILVALFRVFFLSAKEARRGRLRTYISRIGGGENPVQLALDRLNKLVDSEERQAVTDNYGLTNDIKDIVTQVSEDIQGLRLEQGDRATLVHQDRLREILEPTPYPDDIHYNLSKSRVSETGDWLLEDEALLAWLNCETKFLWITGSPGTGKSYLANKLISWGLEFLPNIAFFYFRDGDPETRSVLQALRDVAYQLSSNDAFYAKQLTKRLHSADELKTVPGAFRRLFTQPLEEYLSGKPMFVVLDGIDEAETEQMDQLLKELGDFPPNNESTGGIGVQFALIGKSYLDTTVPWKLAPAGNGQVATVSISRDRTYGDVRLYIEHEVRNNSMVLNSQSEDFKAEVIKRLENKADGLFILAKFMISVVNTKRHRASILQSLQDYPTEINAMLQATLEGLAATVSEDDANDLNEILQWTACAEETLSLEQVEAILILRFTDPPIRLEEALRGQYSCFFELEREDGATTDDLLKEHERQQRQNRQNRSTTARGSPTNGAMSPARTIARRFSSSSPHRSSPKFVLSQPVTGSPTQPGNQSLRRGSPIQNYSPGRMSSPIAESSNEIEYKSNKSTTYVSFFHTTARKFFRERSTIAPTGLGVLGYNMSMIGFDINEARLHVVEICLKIFTEKDWFEKLHLGHGREAIKQYAAWYWQEHFVAYEKEDLPPARSRALARRVYRMLTEKEVILDWTLMYERNNEGLGIFTDKNLQGLQHWFTRPRFLSDLDPEARQWAAKASQNTAFLTRTVGRIYAAAWLSEDFEVYVPTVFCFKIVSSVAFLANDSTWSKSSEYWSKETIVERMTLARDWANYPYTAHCHRRVGSTYLMLEQYSYALHHFYESLKLDDNSTETCGRIAFCLTKSRKYEAALDEALKCVKREEEDLENNVYQGPAKTRSRWRLYKDNLLIAKCYFRVGQLEESFAYFRKAIDQEKGARLGPEDAFEPWIAFFDVLAAKNRHEEMVKLLEELATDKAKHRHSDNRLIDFLLDESNTSLVRDYIPRAVYKSGKVDFFLEALMSAITTALARRDSLKSLHLRLSLAATLTYNLQITNAIEEYERISLYEYRPKGNVPTRQGHAISFQKLAVLYRRQILDAGLASTDGHAWQQKLWNIYTIQDKNRNYDLPLHMLGSDINIASIFVALFYRLQGNEREANRLFKDLILESLEILSDSDPANDKYALDNLVRIFLAADDVENAKALAQSMRKANPLGTTSTQGDSPVHVRAMEPRLPDVQSYQRSCAQCLYHIFDQEHFAICKLCLEFFCTNCLANVIKAGNNKTEDDRIDVICKSDHAWIMVPPLERHLHRGEIWFDDSGRVRGFTEWKDSLKARWEAISPRWERSNTSWSETIPSTSQDSQMSY